jgi:tryptophan-rich sensory protein
VTARQGAGIGTLRRRRPVALAALAAVAVAALGALATDLGPWYQELRQPAWKPPDLLFGPAWTVIYALTALSALIALQATPTAAARRSLLALFGVNAALNVLWSILFFRFQRPDWALFEVVPFWASICVLILATARISRLASGLLVPYLAWVSFAAVLNLAVVRLNAPF